MKPDSTTEFVDRIEKSMTLPEAKFPAPPTMTKRPVVVTSGPVTNVSKEMDALRELDRSFGDLPMRFIRAARALSRQAGCEEQWSTVEQAHDAFRESKS